MCNVSEIMVAANYTGVLVSALLSPVWLSLETGSQQSPLHCMILAILRDAARTPTCQVQGLGQCLYTKLRHLSINRIL